MTVPRALWAEASQLDRSDGHRDSAEWVKGLWYADDTRLVKMTSDGLLAVHPDQPKLRTTRPFVEYDSQRHVLLGLVDDVAWFAVEAVLDGAVKSFREIGADLDPIEADIAVTTSAILNWHRSAPKCPSCGELTDVINGGFARFCHTCHREHFPRTDPAVIVAIVDDEDRLLLARSAPWNNNRVSVLAGFVEAGESFEHAVHREIAEEVDVSLGELHYAGSQPWPFPRSVMVGFFARATSTEISIDGEEIVYADWFSRRQLDAALSAGEVSLPGAVSIAHRLITSWRDGTHPFAN